MLQHEKKIPSRLKEDVHKSYIMPATLYVNNAWCVKECWMGILQKSERSIVNEIYGVQPKDIKNS